MSPKKVQSSNGVVVNFVSINILLWKGWVWRQMQSFMERLRDEKCQCWIWNWSPFQGYIFLFYFKNVDLYDVLITLLWYTNKKVVIG